MLSKLSTRRDGISSFRRAHVAMLATSMALALTLAPVVGWEWAHAGTAATETAAVQLPSLSPLVKKVMPAVVNISVLEKASAGDQTAEAGPNMEPAPMPGFPQGSPFNDFLKKFFQEQGINPNTPELPSPHAQRMALGSGFIIDPSGLVVTNNHVVDGAKKVTVVLQDGGKYSAKILGRDAKTDLALLKIDTGHALPYVSWGDSGSEQVGDWVVAIGNPFGLGGTVSAGIVSARGRDIHSGPYDDYLQIDAPINRGNSGGPTFNLEGQVIGINTAIYSPSGGSVGIGFAIPSDLAKPIIAQLREHGKVSRGWLGVQIQEVTPAIAKALGLPNDHGALVADVTKDSPAEKAGIQQGDVIEAFDGHEVAKMRDLPIMVADTAVGTDAKLKVWRKDHEMTLGLKIAEQPSNLQLAANEGGQSAAPEKSSALGVELEALTPQRREELRVGPDVKGVVVGSIAGSSPLANVDLQPGDVIVSINQHPATTPKEALALLKEGDAGPNQHLLLLLNRHGVNEYVAWSKQAGEG
ncbi:MAG: DegQ family serine endoprotease [Alphaproteobacteria bacterium]